MADASAWIVKAKNNIWGKSQQWEMLERNLVSLSTPRKEMGKGCRCSQPAGAPLVCLLLPMNICPLVGAGESLRLLPCQGRSPEAQKSPHTLAGLGGYLLFPVDLLLSPSFSIASACWGGTSGSSKASFKVPDGSKQAISEQRGDFHRQMIERCL